VTAAFRSNAGSNPATDLVIRRLVRPVRPGSV